LLTLLAQHASFDLALEVAAGASVTELARAGRALGAGLAGPLRMPEARGLASATVPADEALAHVALEASGRPLVVSNVDLSRSHVGGLAGDVVSSFLRELADGAGLTLHVRLLDGEDTQHVLEAIFKALGVALAAACNPH
jgi:imidazoleglycerol-phosphate dehydratase